MSLLRLLILSLLYHWRGNVAVLAGVAVGGTVLTGALLVGDSLRGSLREQSQRRLSWVEHALVAPRFFRETLAGELQKESGGRVSPAMLLQATCARGEGTERVQVRGTTVLAVDASFFAPAEPPTGFGGTEGNVPRAWISQALATQLGASTGSTITLRLQKPTDLPRESALGKKDVVFDDWELHVAAVLADDDPGARFNLRPELTAPRNIVVALPQLQQRLALAGQVNALFAASAGNLNEALGDLLTLEDWGLVLRTPATRARELVQRYDEDGNGVVDFREWRGDRRSGMYMPRYAWLLDRDMPPERRKGGPRTEADFRTFYAQHHPYLSLESRQLYLPPAVVEAVGRAAGEIPLRTAPTLVYLCRVTAPGVPRYAGVVSSLNPRERFPLGPFTPPGLSTLNDDEILLLQANPAPFHRGQPEDWPERPEKGARIELAFKPPESHGPAVDQQATFTLAGYLRPEGAAADPGLTPTFPGITDRDETGTWDIPFDDPDWKRNIAREYGDPFWKQFRSTPKAFITLAKGKALWGSRFGEVTSVRLALPEGHTSDPQRLEKAATLFRSHLSRHLKPQQGGFVFDSVAAGSQEASEGGTPFGLLFLGFSCYLILSALLLVGLLYRLNLDRRAQEAGLLFAEGYSSSQVRKLFLGEGGLLALVGVVLGGLAALAYSRGLVELLAALWPGETLRSFLRPHATPFSLIAGGVGTLVVSVATITWVVRILGRVPPRALLVGQTGEDVDSGRRGRWWRIVIGVCVIGGAALLAVGPFVPGQEARAGTFFGSGSLFLTAGLVGLFAWMKRDGAGVTGRGWGAIARLGVQNAARHPMRSLLTAGLLASAAFLLVAVESFRRRVPLSDGTPNAADGGFSLIAESDLPVIRDLNSEQGRKEVARGLPPAERESAMALLQQTTIIGLRARAGDDASCLNLYKPRSPRVLGVPAALIERKGFVFDGTLAPSAEERANPWLVLQRDGEESAAFGEANTVMWMLRSGLGGKVQVPDEKGTERNLVISGLLHDSVFQSSLLVSEERFLRLYPTQEGYNFFLIQPPAGREADVKRVLERGLVDRGLEVTATAERVEAYLAVENTYLTTFQALGGLGLMLGSLGLAVVLLRSVWERRAELALLRALGWRRLALGWLVLAENAFLLLAGLAIGTTAALLSIIPQLVAGSAATPVMNLLALFAGAMGLALAAGAVATVLTLRTPIVPALRRE